MYEIETKLRSYSSPREVQQVNSITKYNMKIVRTHCGLLWAKCFRIYYKVKNTCIARKKLQQFKIENNKKIYVKISFSILYFYLTASVNLKLN